jgi:hypothetical protein
MIRHQDGGDWRYTSVREGGRHVDVEESLFLVERVIRRREETRAAQKMIPCEPVELNFECSKTSRKTIHNRVDLRLRQRR